MNNKMIKNLAIGAAVGAGLGYIYLLTLGKGKNLKMLNVLAIGGGIGAVVGVLASTGKSKPEPITEESLRALAKTIDQSTEEEVDSYIMIIRKAKTLTEPEKQRIYKVINALLLAKKDNKWDEKADLETKKTILMQYGITQEDFTSFNEVVIKGLSDILVGAVSDLFNPKNQ